MIVKNLAIVLMGIFIFVLNSGITNAAEVEKDAVKLSPIVSLMDVPPSSKETILTQDERTFGFRGRIGGYMLKPSKFGIYIDGGVNYTTGKKKSPSIGWPVDGAIKMSYEKKGDEKSFCGTYVIILGDLSKYKAVSFMVKGQKGGETFEVGINDAISDRREDAVIAGTVYRFLPEGMTTKWQEVTIPLSDFFGVDLSCVYCLVFNFNEEGKGTVWIDDIKFHEVSSIDTDMENEIVKKGFLLLDNFDHSDLNFLGRKANAYKKLPSYTVAKRTSEEFYGKKGKSLKLTYKKEPFGWCGYYSLLNRIDGDYYDLSRFETVSFMVKGQKGGETFEIGMADEKWLNIGDSVKAGVVENYLPGGVTTEWKEVKIPLRDFGMLDLSMMGSVVINFHKNGEGVIYIDDLKFYLKQEVKRTAKGKSIE